MKEIKKESLVKLKDGKIVKIKSNPSGWMSNGSYEVIEWVDNGLGEIGKPFWVEPTEISHELNKEHMDDLENYFEFIFNEEGLHIVPKDINLVKVDSDGDLKKIVLDFNDTKHKEVVIYLGETVIEDEKELCETPEKPTFKDKIKNIIDS